MMRRIDLSDLQEGAWADIYEKASWGLTRRLIPFYRRAAEEAGEDGDVDKAMSPEDQDAVGTIMLSQMVGAWNVRNLRGEEVAIPKLLADVELDDIDRDVLIRLGNEIRALIAQGQPDPKATSDSSSSSPETPTSKPT